MYCQDAIAHALNRTDDVLNEIKKFEKERSSLDKKVTKTKELAAEVLEGMELLEDSIASLLHPSSH